MKFLVDRCAGQRLAVWLRAHGHDVLASWDLGPDPGDQALLERAAAAGRVLVTIDTDFGELVYVQAVLHAGIVRLPDVPAAERIALMAQVLQRHQDALAAQAISTSKGCYPSGRRGKRAEPQQDIVLIGWCDGVQVPFHASQKISKIVDSRRHHKTMMPLPSSLPQAIQTHKVTSIERQKRSALLGSMPLRFIREPLIGSTSAVRAQHIIPIPTEDESQGWMHVLVTV